MARPRRARPASVADLAIRLAALLPEPNALVGGLAVTAHGYVRATDDVDFVSPADPKAIQAGLAAAGIESAVRRGDFLDGDIASVVHGSVGGIHFDVLFPPVPIDWDRTVRLPLPEAGTALRVVDLDALIRLKLRAGGPQDLIDVVQLVRRHPEQHERAASVAEAYGLRNQLDAWLADPRIRSPESPPPLPRPGSRARRGASKRRRPGRRNPSS